MVAVNMFSGIGKMRRDFNKFETKTMNLIQRNAMLDAAYRTQRVLRLRSYPKAFPSAVNKEHKNYVTRIGMAGAREGSSKAQLKTAIQTSLARRRRADIAIFDATRKGSGNKYMIDHALGGIKTASSGSHIAVPTDYVRLKRTSKGIPDKWKPEQVLSAKGRKAAFITKINGKDMIVQRQGKKDRSIIPLYSLVQNVRIRKSFKFYEDARVYNKLYDAAFAKEYAFRANKTMKRRYAA